MSNTKLTQERLRELSEIAAGWWVWRHPMSGLWNAGADGLIRIRLQHGQSGVDLGCAGPDLSDPATVGLLPFVGRKVSGIETLHARCRVPYGMTMSGGHPPSWSLHDGLRPCWAEPCPTEVEAWVLGIDALVARRERAE